MPNKMDVPQIVRDRSNDQDNTTQSNGAYVQDLKKTTTVLPPAKPFKEKSKQENQTSANKNKKKPSIVGAKETEKRKAKDAKKIEQANVFKMEQIFSLEQITELGPEVKAQELTIQFQIATQKYLSIKKMLSQSQKTSIEDKLTKLQKRIYELVRNSSSGATKKTTNKIKEENPFEGDASSMFGFIPIKDRDKEEEDPNASNEKKKESNPFGFIAGKDRDKEEKESN